MLSYFSCGEGGNRSARENFFFLKDYEQIDLCNCMKLKINVHTISI